MSKTLSNILTVFKVLRIIAKVVFILCIVGAVGSLVGLVALPVAQLIVPSEVLIENGFEGASTYAALCAGIITCLGEGAFAFFAEKYFSKIMNDGTPFTFDGAKESMRLGLISIIVSVAVSVMSGLVLGIIILVSGKVTEFNFESSVNITTGLFFMFMSLIFKHGAELKARGEEEIKTDDMNENA